jgi:glycosyltransferase involved in cell wall biosynthesis
MVLPELPPSPLVSVLLPSYNYERYLPEAIGSIIRQTYRNWELIVCDDGSSDNSRAVVSRYSNQDPRIRLICQPNGGQASALNSAFAASQGSILCILDADDTFRPQKLARVLDQFQRQSDAGLLVHAMTLIDGGGVTLHRIPILGSFEEGWIADRVLQRGGRWRYMPSSGLVFRRELAEIGFPIAQRRFVEGAEGFLFTLFPLLTKITYIADELSTYRIHGSNMGGRLGVNAAAARKGAKLMTQVVEGVNERLNQMASPDTLDVEANLHIALELLIAHLLEGEPRPKLYRRYFRAVRAILADDLYGARQKLLLPALFGGATLLPRRWRQAWLDLAISSGTLKRTMVRIFTGFRRPVRLSPDVL